MMQSQRHPHAERITREFQEWATAANEDRPTNDTERQRLRLAAKAPLRSKGRPVEDAGHLPLFIAGNEPTLI